MNILFVNGSRGGSKGNTSLLLDLAEENLKPHASVSRLTLRESLSLTLVRDSIEKADGFIFATGTYWDSWGSPLQKFLEDLTDTEGSELWLGKPAAVVVTMHAVGGKGVLSRLQGVLNTFGVSIPPMSGLVCSASNQLALQAPEHSLAEDLWRPDDIAIVCHNLLQSCLKKTDWKTWPVDRGGFDQVWLKQP